MPDYASATIELLRPENGGRSLPTTAVDGQYRPHLRTDPNGEYLGVCLVDGPIVLSPGDQADVTFLLVYEVDYSPLQPNRTFEIVEGRQIVGRGVITKRWSEESPTVQQ